jgi:bifunctional oligoribonuclease and PAP phosphatase NrnA
MISEVSNILNREDGFLVVTHINPDGDAVGSMLGLCTALREMGKEARALCVEKIPDVYHFLPGVGEILTNPDELPGRPKWIICVDVAAENRISGDIARFRSGARLINIDHHPTNPAFGDLNVVEPAATSTAEIVFKVLKQAGYRLSQDVGKCLYTGLLTDTGGFRFPGVTKSTMLLAAEMLEPGFDSYEITKQVYEQYPFCRFHLEHLMLERIEVLLNGRLTLSALFDEDFKRLGADYSDSENLVNRLREVRGVEVAVLMTQLADGAIRVSFRSKNHVDVGSIAESFGGGGHHRAAGLRSTLPFNDLKEEIVSAIAKALCLYDAQ